MGAIERWLAQTGQVPQAATRTPDNTAIPAGLPSGGLVGSAISGGASFDEILRTSFRPSTVNSVSSNSPSSNFDGGQRDSRARADRVDAGRTARDPGNRSSRDRVSQVRDDVSRGSNIAREMDAAHTRRRHDVREDDVSPSDDRRFSIASDASRASSADDRDEERTDHEYAATYGGPVSSTSPTPPSHDACGGCASESPPTVAPGLAGTGEAPTESTTSNGVPVPAATSDAQDSTGAISATPSAEGFSDLIDSLPPSEFGDSSAETASIVSPLADGDVETPIVAINSLDPSAAPLEVVPSPSVEVVVPAEAGDASGERTTTSLGTSSPVEGRREELATEMIGDASTSRLSPTLNLKSATSDTSDSRLDGAAPTESASPEIVVDAAAPVITQPQRVVERVVSRTPVPSPPVVSPLFSTPTEGTSEGEPSLEVPESLPVSSVGPRDGAANATGPIPAVPPAGLVEGLWGAIQRGPARAAVIETGVGEARTSSAEVTADAWSGLAGSIPPPPDQNPQGGDRRDADASTNIGIPSAAKRGEAGETRLAAPRAVAEPRIEPREFLTRQVLPGLATARDEGRAVTLRLDPPELGALRVQVTVRDRSVVAVLEAERPETRQLLGDNLAQLRDALQQQGFGIDRIEVSLADGRFDDQRSAGNGGLGGQQSGSREGGEAGSQLPVETPRPPANRQGSTVPKPHIASVKSGIDVQV